MLEFIKKFMKPRKDESGLVKIVTESNGREIDAKGLAWLGDKTRLLLLTDNRLYDSHEISKIDPFAARKGQYQSPLNARYVKDLKKLGFKLEYLEHEGLAQKFLVLHSEYVMAKFIIENWASLEQDEGGIRPCMIQMPNGESRNYDIIGTLEDHKKNIEAVQEELGMCLAARISHITPKLKEHIIKKTNFALLINKAELETNALAEMLDSYEHIVYSAKGKIISYHASPMWHYMQDKLIR